MAVALGLVLGPGAGSARADQCEPREVVSFDTPRDGGTVPPNVRFRVLVYTGCSSIPPGPPSEFQLLSPSGAPVPLLLLRWGDYREYAPADPLPAGRYKFRHRHAASAKLLGPWKDRARVEVRGEADRAPPALTGRLELTARPI